MAPPSTPRVLVHGSGAVGIAYIYLLCRAGWHVTATCRSNYTAARADGFHIDSALWGDGLRARPEIVRSPEEAASPLDTDAGAAPRVYDYVIVTTKALPQAKTSETIAPAVTPGHTTIVLIQNGVGIEEEYALRFPENPLLSCVVYIPTSQIRHGYVQMGGVEKLEIGSYPTTPNPPSAATQTLLTALQQAGSNTSWAGASLQEKRWHKLLLNVVWNPISALTFSRDTGFLLSSPSASPLASHITAEIVAVAAAQGFTSITQALAEDLLAWHRQNPHRVGTETSMLADVRGGRPLEVEVILGNPLKKARELGVDTPRLEVLYVLTKALDESARRRKDGMPLTGLDYDGEEGGGC